MGGWQGWLRAQVIRSSQLPWMRTVLRKACQLTTWMVGRRLARLPGVVAVYARHSHPRFVTFAPGQTPPVNGFWSLTVYNKEHLFEPNRLNRFSLGTKSKLMKAASDGSLTLYFQNKSPGADKEPNWVPTPIDEFSLYIRAYWPKDEVLNGSWRPPVVTRAT